MKQETKQKQTEYFRGRKGFCNLPSTGIGQTNSGKNDWKKSEQVQIIGNRVKICVR